MATTTTRALIRASGGPRYVAALGVDALGTGLLRPFLLLYGVTVLGLSAPVTGVAMTAGVVTGLVCVPAAGRWLDRGARSAVVAASMLVRVLGVALLVATPAGNVGLFAAAALFLGIGNQVWPAAHAALVATLAQGRDRDAALAAGRALRNAGLGAGALLATACLAGGATGLRVLAAGTGLAYLAAAALAWSVRVRARPAAAMDGDGDGDGDDGPASGMGVLLAANVIYVFCLNVPEIALPLVLVTQLHASPVWPAAVFVANTVLVITLQVPVTVLLSRFRRRTVLALAGVVLAVSYLGFLAAMSLGDGWGAPAVAVVSVVCTLGEIVYAGSATALVAARAPARVLGRALARFQLSTGFGLAVSPAVLTALAPYGPAVLWGGLAGATLLSASAVAVEPSRSSRRGRAGSGNRIGEPGSGPSMTGVDQVSQRRQRRSAEAGPVAAGGRRCSGLVTSPFLCRRPEATSAGCGRAYSYFCLDPEISDQVIP